VSVLCNIDNNSEWFVQFPRILLEQDGLWGEVAVGKMSGQFGLLGSDTKFVNIWNCSG
jgi:hypothetical protein